MDTHGAIPFVTLVVGGTPLPAASTVWLKEIELIQNVDGANILMLRLDGWDPLERRHRFLDERMLFPGSRIELWAGYTPSQMQPVCKGIYEVSSRSVEYSADGVQVCFTAFDGLRRLMDHTQPRVLRGMRCDSDAVEELAREYRLAVEVQGQPVQRDDIYPPGVLPSAASLTAPARTRVAPLARTPASPGDRLKPAGETDLSWLKRMAEYNGYLYPQVRYVPKAMQEEGTEVLHFRPATFSPDDLTQRFWFRKTDSEQGDLVWFRTDLDAADAPMAVEITGWDPDQQKAFRVVARADEAAPQVEWESGQPVDAKVSGELRCGAALRLSVLKRGGVTRDRAIEALPAHLASSRTVPNLTELSDYARRLLVARQAQWWTMEAELVNQPGLHLLDIDQVHEFRGVSPLDEGLYHVLEARHEWSAGMHRVRLRGQRVVDPDDIVVQMERG